MLFLIAIIAAAAWLLGRFLFPQSSLALKIRFANLGTVYQQPALASTRYGLIGRPDYLVRVENGIAPVELKSGKAPRSGRPYDGHLLQRRHTASWWKMSATRTSPSAYSNTRIAASPLITRHHCASNF
jgi:hypothetical protein